MIKFAAAFLLLMLTACGGGENQDEVKSTQPVDCRAEPKACQ